MPRKTRKQKMRAHRKHIQVRPQVVRPAEITDLSCSCYLGDNEAYFSADPAWCRNPVHVAAYQHVDIPKGMQVKVTYIINPLRPQYKSQAYINKHTGEGNNKHTDEYVRVEWRDEFDCWVNTIVTTIN